MLVVVLAEDDAHEMVVLVHDGQGVELVLPDDVVGVLERDVLVAHDELLARGHELGDLLLVVVAAGAVVAAGHDAEEPAAGRAVVGDGHGGVAGTLLELHDLLHRHVRREGGVGLHEAGLVVLDGLDHGRLLLGRLVAVDEGEAALDGQGDAHVDAGDGLHDGRDHGDVEAERGLLAATKPHERGLERHVGGDVLRRGVSGDEQVLGKGVGLPLEERCHVPAPLPARGGKLPRNLI